MMRQPSAVEWVAVHPAGRDFYVGTPEEVKLLAVGAPRPDLMIRYVVQQRPGRALELMFYHVSSGTLDGERCIAQVPSETAARLLANLHYSVR